MVIKTGKMFLLCVLTGLSIAFCLVAAACLVWTIAAIIQATDFIAPAVTCAGGVAGSILFYRLSLVLKQTSEPPTT